MGSSLQAKPISLVSILCSIIFLLSLFTIPSVSADQNKTLSAYEVLQSYDFPVGILPQGVVGYELVNSTGNFKVHLKGPCSFKTGPVEWKYDATVNGVIAKDNISSLQGVVVDKLLNIKGVARHQDELTIIGGIGSVDLSVKIFDKSPKCD